MSKRTAETKLAQGDFLKKMRLKFFWVTAGIVSGLMAAFCGSILLTEYLRLNAFESRQRPYFPIEGAEDFARQIENQSFAEHLTAVLSMGAAALTLLLVFIWFLSFWIVKPAKKGLEKQQRFISEASHELKTPLTVISAGVELIQGQKINEETKKWLADIKQQTERMSTMTGELLMLSKLDEIDKPVCADFDLSQTILNEVLTFESVAFEQQKELVTDIQSGLIYKGNSKAAVQAVGILCDNAIKYSAEKTIIKVDLKKQNSKIVLAVSNSSDRLREDEVPFLFERFYRGSESRAAFNGTGLGLSILKAIADKNNWKISILFQGNEFIIKILF